MSYNQGEVMPDTSLDTIGPWSRDKLEMLRRYLVAYTNIMTSDKVRPICRSFHYVDAFAGSVEHVDAEQQTIIDGSPLIALKTVPPFHSYTFIEAKSSRIKKRILPLKDDYPDNDISVLRGDCNKKIIEEILPLFPHRKHGYKKLGFIFLDPYGINLHWNTVAAIGASGVFDVLINFSVMGIIRQCSEKPPTGATKQTIDNLMGTDDWLSVIYKEPQQKTLFPIPAHYDRHGSQLPERLADLYRKKLNSCFCHVSDAIIMRNNQGGPLYALILASQAQLAVTKMHEVFRHVERSRQQEAIKR